jgi:hypothetical protein
MIFGPGKEPGRDADQLTATKVAGKKNMPSIEIVFIEELSSLLAFANKAELSASLVFTFMSFWVIYWKTWGYQPRVEVLKECFLQLELAPEPAFLHTRPEI